MKFMHAMSPLAIDKQKTVCNIAMRHSFKTTYPMSPLDPSKKHTKLAKTSPEPKSSHFVKGYE